MKYYIITLFSVFLLFSCNNDLENLNENTKQPTEVPSATLFSAGQKAFFDQMVETNVNFNNFRLFAQHWTETTYLDEANYDLVGRNIPEQQWRVLYRDVLRDLKESKAILATEEAITDAQIATKQNTSAALEVMIVHAYSILVETFGDIPYSQALDIDNYLLPAYDNQADIYADLLKRLNAAIANMDVANDGPIGDHMYDSDMSLWLKYANSLKMKMGMRISDANPAISQQMVESAVSAGVFTSNADNATLAYEADQPNTNPVYVALVASGRQDFIPANTLVDTMLNLNDPRVDLYFDPNTKIDVPIDTNGNFITRYLGGTYGVSSAYSKHSHITQALHSPTFPGTLMNYSEVEFLLAEAAERGYSVGGSAEDHYNNGITASIMEWGGNAEMATTYMSQPSVAYATADGDYKQKIGMQKWIALYNRGYEAWTEWRRLDVPRLVAPPEATSVIPLRYTYPILEQNLNGANYQAAASAIGGDNVATKLFWDKN